jgi:hypothetical protein
MNYVPLTDALRPLSDKFSRPAREHEVLRFSATLGGPEPVDSASSARTSVLKWVEASIVERLPQQAWKHAAFEHNVGGRNCSVVRITGADDDIWALRSDRPDAAVAGRVWTTEVVIAYSSGTPAFLSLRLLVNSSEAEIEISPAVPSLLHDIAADPGLYCGHQRLRSEPRWIETSDDVDRLISWLLSKKRRHPIFVLTTVNGSDTNHGAPLLDPEPLAKAMMGLAEVVVMPAPFTWALTNQLGRRLSVFGGALRLYMPNFNEDSDPSGDHYLILAERLGTFDGRQRAATILRRRGAAESLRALRLGADVLSFASVRDQSLTLAREQLVKVDASDGERLKMAETQIDALHKDLNRTEEVNQWLLDEHKLIEDRARLAESQLRAAGFQIQQLLARLHEQGEEPDAGLALPSSWGEFTEWSAQNLVGRLILSSCAKREVKATKFKDVRLAARCLLWLANTYREGRISGNQGNLRTTVESGVINDRCGSDSFQIDWQGRRCDVEWHIKNGGNTRDPGRCLRIYYFWDDVSQQVVVASMPAHRVSAAS